MTLEGGLKAAAAVVALGGLIVSAATYLETARRNADTRRLEVRKPFLDRQLALYTEATRVTAKLATGKPEAEDYATARERFEELYWGELALVEDSAVEAAMVHMRRRLQGEDSRCETLGQCSLEVARACRSSLAKTWGIEDWLPPREPTPRSAP